MSANPAWCLRLLVSCAVLAVLAVGAGLVAPVPADAQVSTFVSTWDTRNTSTGSSAANRITLPWAPDPPAKGARPGGGWSRPGPKS